MITALSCLALGALVGYGWRRAEKADEADAHWADVVSLTADDGCHYSFHEVGTHEPRIPTQRGPR